MQDWEVTIQNSELEFVRHIQSSISNKPGQVNIFEGVNCSRCQVASSMKSFCIQML